MAAPMAAVLCYVLCSTLRARHPTVECKQLALELLSQLFSRLPQLPAELMANFDCMPHGPDLMEQLVRPVLAR